MLFLKLLYTVSPIILGGILHMVVVQKKIGQGWAKPLDGGATWRGRRWFGDHKTWRGFVVIVLGTALLTLMQGWLEGMVPTLRDSNLVNLARLGAFPTGLLWGLGYALPELPNSFVKRQLGIAEGQGSKSWAGLFQTLIDQADSAIGCAVVAYLGFAMSAADALYLALFCTILHLLLNFLLGTAGLRQRRV